MGPRPLGPGVGAIGAAEPSREKQEEALGANLSLPTPLRNDWMGVVSLAQPVAEWFVSRIDRNRKNRAEHGNGSKAKAPPAPEPNDRKEQVVVKSYYTGIGGKKAEQDLESGMQAALKRIKSLEEGLHLAMQRIDSLEEDNAKMRRSLQGLLQGESPPTNIFASSEDERGRATEASPSPVGLGAESGDADSGTPLAGGGSEGGLLAARVERVGGGGKHYG